MEKFTKNKKGYIIILILFSLLLTFVNFKDSLMFIKGGSMEPTLFHNDLVFIASKAPSKVKVGDIVVISSAHYYFENGGEPIFSDLENNTKIVHRVIDKKAVNGTWFFLTKGDNNNLIDGSIISLYKSQNYSLFEYNASNGIFIPEIAIESIVLFRIPLIGYLQEFSAIILTLVFLTILLDIMKQKIKISNFYSSTKFLKRINKTLFMVLLLILISSILMHSIDGIYFMNNESMGPYLQKDDLIISERRSPDKFKINDIVIIKSPKYFYEKGFDPIFWNFYPNNSYLIHRIIEKKMLNGSWYFVTQGDNSQWQPDGIFKTIIKIGDYDYFKFELNTSNNLYIEQEAILGVVVIKIPVIGIIVNNFAYIIGIVLVMIIILSIKIRKLNRKLLNSE